MPNDFRYKRVHCTVATEELFTYSTSIVLFVIQDHLYGIHPYQYMKNCIILDFSTKNIFRENIGSSIITKASKTKIKEENIVRNKN